MRRPGLPTILPAVVGVGLMLGMHCFQSSILAQNTRRPAIADVSWRRSSDTDDPSGTAIAAAGPEPAAPRPAPPRETDTLPEEPYTAALGPEGDSESGTHADLPYDPIAPTKDAETPASAVVASSPTPATPWAEEASQTPRRSRQADVSVPAPAVEGRVPADPACAPTAPQPPTDLPYRPVRTAELPAEDTHEPLDEPDLAVADRPVETDAINDTPVTPVAPLDERTHRPDAPAVAAAEPEGASHRPAELPRTQPRPVAQAATATEAPALPTIAGRTPKPMVVRPDDADDSIEAPLDDADQLATTPAEDEDTPSARRVRTLSPAAPDVTTHANEPIAASAAPSRPSRSEVDVQPVLVGRSDPVAVDAPTAQAAKPDQPEVLASVDRRPRPETTETPSAPTTRENDETDKPTVVAKTDPKVKQAVRKAIVNDGEPDHPTKDRNLMLMMALQDPDKYVRKWAAEMLGGTGDKRAVKPLIRRLSDSDWWVRRAAMYSLMQIGDDTAVKPITRSLRKGSSWRDRQVAALVLGKMNATSAIPALMVQLNSGDDRVRIACAAALGQLGDAQAVPALQKAMAEGDKAVRLAAKRALKRIAASEVVSR